MYSEGPRASIRRTLACSKNLNPTREDSVKRKLIGCLLGSVLLVSAAWSQAGKTEQAVADMEQKWLQSQKTNNPDLVAPLLADKFVITLSDGKVLSKADYLKMAKARKYTAVDYTEMKVTVFGDTAIATGGFKGKGTEAGKAFDEHERWTDTWVKMPDGKWQCVASHGSAVKM